MNWRPSQNESSINSTGVKITQTLKKRKKSIRKFCSTSGPILLILTWMLAIGSIYEGAGIIVQLFIITIQDAKSGMHKPQRFSFPVYMIAALNTILAFTGLFYPIGGYLGDVKYGRFKMINTSLFFLWVCLILTIIMSTVYTSSPKRDMPLYIAEFVIGSVALVLFFVAQAGFISNIIQFSFDQLLDRPSHHLGMFVHWYIWAENLGQTAVDAIYAFYACTSLDSIPNHKILLNILMYLPSVCLVILTISLVINFVWPRVFFTANIQSNPYKLILNLLGYARKTRRAVRPRSAFTYSYHRKPSRLDLAKQVYGGPYANSDVDDVKTFLRVLVVLLALGPVFTLLVPSSTSFFSIFGNQTGSNDAPKCAAQHTLLESGLLSKIFSVIFIPFYIGLIYWVLRNRMPKILTRLGISVIITMIGLFSMLVIDVAGNTKQYLEHGVSRNTTCMLYGYGSPKSRQLELPFWVLIAPNLLIAVGPSLLLATALEFISAQGPHAMKGVLVGLLYAIKGFYKLIGAVLVFPFGSPKWKHAKDTVLASIITCEFGYFLVCLTIGCVGFVLFVVAGCKYKYRIRGEEEFRQSDVEEVFERQLLRRQEYERRNSEQELTSCEDTEEYYYPSH